MLLDFMKEVIGEPTVLIGNSIGSLACTIVAAGKFLLVSSLSWAVSIAVSYKHKNLKGIYTNFVQEGWLKSDSAFHSFSRSSSRSTARHGSAELLRRDE